MKYVILLFCFSFVLAFQLKAQNYYWIAFTDKNDTEYSLENPADYLSERSIERREKQNILIDSLDLPVNKVYIDSVLTLDVQYVHSSKWLNGMTVETELDSLGKLILDWSFVDEVQRTKSDVATKSVRNKFEDTNGESVSIDTSYYGQSVYQMGMLNGQYFHENNYKGQGMHIAVIDAGFLNADNLSAFDSLWTNNQILGTKDFVNPESNFFETYYHGMSVLSCMGGNIPGSLIGTAPDASYWLIRSEDSSTEYIIEEDNWVVAAEFADSVGVDIINSSLGYYQFDDEDTDHTYADMDGKTTRVTQAANVAASRGMLVFSSAGNERDDEWQRIIAPSDGDAVIGVGAVDVNLNPAYFTSAGPASDGDIKPNVAAMGFLTIVQYPNGMVSVANGTSFSSPVLAGMAACLWQKNPEKTQLEIKEAIEASGHQYLSPDSLIGYGVPDMQLADELLNPTSAEIISRNSYWTVYPNPVIDNIVIQYSGNIEFNEVNISLINVSGQLLKSWTKSAGNKIAVNNIPDNLNGLFFLKIDTENYSEIVKLIKY